MSTRFKYHIAGIELESEVELPGAEEIDEFFDSAVQIRFGRVPASLPAVTSRVSAFEVNGEDALVTIPNVARYWIRQAREIVIQPSPGALDNEVRAFLVASPLGTLIQQRGLIPLHASAIRVGDSCVAITGLSGIGKSTLCAVLNSRRYSLVSDDLLSVRMTSDGPLAYPGLCRLNLWQDVGPALGIDLASLPRVRPMLLKHELQVVNRYYGEALPLTRIYHLCESADGLSEGLSKQCHAESLEMVLNNTHRNRYPQGTPSQERQLRMCGAMLPWLEISRLTRPADLSRLNEVADWLESDWHEMRHRYVRVRAA